MLRVFYSLDFLSGYFILFSSGIKFCKLYLKKDKSQIYILLYLPTSISSVKSPCDLNLIGDMYIPTSASCLLEAYTYLFYSNGLFLYFFRL